jgi:hypothetical protein
MISFDLALHPSTAALLLAAAADSPIAAFAYDGDDLHTLPSAVRALASGVLLLDPAAVARGASWFGEAEPAGEAAAAAAAAALAGSEDNMHSAGALHAGQKKAPKAAAAAAVQRSLGGTLTAAGAAAAAREAAAAAAMGWQPLLLLPGQQQLPLTAILAMQLPQSLGQQRQQQQQQHQHVQHIVAAVKGDVLLQQLLLADVGGLLSRVGSSQVLAAVLDCWPAAAPLAAAAAAATSDEAAWQQAMHAGDKWWQHLQKLADAAGSAVSALQQQSNVVEWLDLAVPPGGQITVSRAGNRKLSAPTAAAAASASFKSGPQPSATAAAVGGLSPAEIMSNPGLLQSLLDHSRQQQQQQHVRERQCTLQQLRRDYGWEWGCVERAQPAAAAAAAAGGQRQLLPAAVAQAVAGRWWAGPVMRGSALEGSVHQQAAT